MPQDYDSPWKEILEAYFPDFMAFFFPEAHRDIDWSKGYQSLDKELQKIVRGRGIGHPPGRQIDDSLAPKR